MPNNDDNDDTAVTVAALGGGALLAWLLLRGRFGLGGGGGGGGARARAGTGRAGSGASSAERPAGPPCRVFIRARTIEVDGAPVDVETMVRTCRAVGGATLGAAGDAITGTLEGAARALNRAGIPMVPDAWIAEPVRAALARRAP